MARQLSLPKLWAQYLTARLAVMGLTMFDIRSNLHMAATLGRLLYRFDKRHRDRTTRHLQLSFPTLDRASIDGIALKSFEHLAQLAVEICQAPRLIHEDSWPHQIRLKTLGQTVDLLQSDKPIILVTGHFGNWEIMGYFLAMLGYRIDALARPIDNPLINHWLLDIRQRRGMRIITKWKATRRMLDVLETGGSLGFIADQNAGSKGLFVPFFGRLASTYKSIGLLALKQNIPIVCGYARRLEPNLLFELGTTDIIYPEDWSNQADPLFYITARYIRAIENMVKLSPEQYLWMHRRWKSRPRHEKLNKPFPSTLRKKLEALPWMDQAELDRVMQRDYSL